jgi:hypothetical protein
MLDPAEAQAVAKLLKCRVSRNKASRKKGDLHQDPIWDQWTAEDKSRLTVGLQRSLGMNSIDSADQSRSRCSDYPFLSSPSRTLLHDLMLRDRTKASAILSSMRSRTSART